MVRHYGNHATAQQPTRWTLPPVSRLCAALSEHAGVVCIESFDGLPSQPELLAPAILLDGQRVAPSDGVILSPEDLGAALSCVYPAAPQLQAILEQVLEDYLQEWS